MRLPGLGRRNAGTEPAEPRGRVDEGAGLVRPRRSLRARVLRTLLLAGLFAAFTSPGRRLVRSIARWADRHVETFKEPESLVYVRVIAPFLGRLYRRTAEEVGAELGNLPKGERATVVDIGCGTGELAVAISKRLRQARIVGIDASPSMLLWASRHETTDGRIRFLVGDGARLPVPDVSVDVVVSTLSLHHWTDPAAVLTEIDRVLAPGGCALIYDLGLLTLTRDEMARALSSAGIPPETMRLERVRGGLLSRLFVRFRFDPDTQAASDG
jgi:SAM-dependent methyltransferase